MKRLFISAILVSLCLACSSCNTKPPVNTTDASESEPTDASAYTETTKTTDYAKPTSESTSERITEPTAESSTEPITSEQNWALTKQPDNNFLFLSADCSLISGMRWVNLYNNIYALENPTAKISMCLPQDASIRWPTVEFNGGAQSLYYLRIYEMDEHISLNTFAEQIGISAFPSFFYERSEPIIDDSKYYKQLFYYDDSENNSYIYFCMVRLSDNYVLSFRVEGTTQDQTVLDLIINTASLIEISDQWEKDQAIKINEPVKPVRLSEFYCVEKDSTGPLDYVMQDVMPEEVILQISLPKSWALLPTPEKFFEIQKTYFFSELGIPKVGVCTEQCLYQCFVGLYFYPSTYNGKPFRCFMEGTPGLEEGTTATGNNYWLCRTEAPTYHAIEYDCYVQVSETYIYHFMLCLDVDNADLVYDIMDSIQFSIGDDE